MSKKNIVRQALVLEGLIGKAIASVCALSLVIGGYHFSDVRNIASAQASLETIGARMSLASADTFMRLADAVNIVGGSYLAALNNAGIYASAGISSALGASRDIVSISRPEALAAAYEGATPFLGRAKGFFSRFFGTVSSEPTSQNEAPVTDRAISAASSTPVTSAKPLVASMAGVPASVSVFPNTVIRERVAESSGISRSEVDAMIRERIEGLAVGGSPALNSNQQIVYRSNSLQTDSLSSSLTKGIESLRLSIYNRLVSKLAFITDLFADNFVAGNATSTNLTSLNAVLAPSFNATSTTETSVFAGSLNVGGNIKITDSSRIVLGPQDDYDYIQNTRLSTASGRPFTADIAGLLTLGSGRDNGEGIVFSVAGGERARISSSGNLGIGTQDPQTQLEVNGTARARQFESRLFGYSNDNSFAFIDATSTIHIGSEPADGGQVFINDGSQLYVFEFDDNGTSTPGRIPVTLGGTVEATLASLSGAITSSGGQFVVDEHILDGYIGVTIPDFIAPDDRSIGTDSSGVWVDGFHIFGEYSAITFGNSNDLNANEAFAFGRANVLDAFETFVFGSGNLAKGVGSFSFGLNNSMASTTSGSYSFGESNVIESANQGYVFGRNNQVTGNDSFTFGLANTLTGGGGTSVFGSFNSGPGTDGYVFGKGNDIQADRVYAVGSGNIMTGVESYSFGQTNTVGSSGSLALGRFNEVSGGASSFAFGHGNIVNGDYSFSMGSGNDVTASGSFAFGNGLAVSIPNIVQIGTSDVAKITIDALGFLGVGVDEPTAQLHTTGSVRFASLGSAGANLITDADGNVTVSSDERLKDVQGTFTRGLAALQGVNPITYRWNSVSGLETKGLYTGFSAQNIRANIPEAVGTDSRGYLTLSDRPILAAAVNAIKELNLSVTGIMERVSGLEERVSSLEGRFASGITTIDRATGKASCIYVENGVITSMPAECAAAQVPVSAPTGPANQPSPDIPETIASSSTQESVIDVPVATSSSETSPVQEPVPEPSAMPAEAPAGLEPSANPAEAAPETP